MLVKKIKSFKTLVEDKLLNGAFVSKEVINTEGKAVKEFFMINKDRFIVKMREGQRAIEQIRRGEISLALEEVLKHQSALFTEK